MAVVPNIHAIHKSAQLRLHLSTGNGNGRHLLILAESDLKLIGLECGNAQLHPKLLNKEHELISYSEANGFCTVFYEYPEFHMTDEIVLESSNGLLHSYTNRVNGKTVHEVEVLISNSSYPFDDDMFRVLK